MIRTQIYLPEDLHRELTLPANTGKTTISKLIREGAHEVIKKREVKRHKASKKAWGKGFIGAVKTGVKTDAVKDIHDYYLHGVIK